MWFPLLVALGATSINAAADSSILYSEKTVFARVGWTVTLPCWLAPPMNAEQLEVRWYRPTEFKKPVLLYKDKQFENSSQPLRYKGRTSLDPRNCNSDGLKEGDLSLKLDNVSLEDAGEYTCYYTSNKGYGSTIVSLNVTAVGTPPLLSLLWVQGGAMVNVSCVSSGWKPQPRLVWSDGQKSLPADSLLYIRSDANSLVSVHSWILHSSSDSEWVSCSLSLLEEEALEGRVATTLQEDSTDSWKVAFIISLLLLLIIIILIVLVVLYKRRRTGPVSVSGYIQIPVKPLCSPQDIEALREYKVNIEVDPAKAHSSLKISKDGKIIRDDINSGAEFSQDILGTTGFTSGNVYWEVGLSDPTTGVKESWRVGVASVKAKKEGDELPSDLDGRWYLSSDREKGLSINIPTDTSIEIPIQSKPEVLGIFLEYDNGRLSFYNVRENTCLTTLSIKFLTKVYPLFNPGVADKAPLKILTLVSKSATPSDCIPLQSDNS